MKHRSILYYPVSALATLFTHILQHPKHSNAHDDLKRISGVVAFLSQLERNAIQGKASLRRMAAMCKGFYEIAERAIRNAKVETASINKQRGDETIPKDSIMSEGNLSALSVPESSWLISAVLPGAGSTEDLIVNNGSHEAQSGSSEAMGALGEISATTVPQPQSVTLPAMSLDMDDYGGFSHGQNTYQMLVGREETVSHDPWQMPISLDLGEADRMGMGWDLFDRMNFDADLMLLDNTLTEDMVLFQD